MITYHVLALLLCFGSAGFATWAYLRYTVDKVAVDFGYFVALTIPVAACAALGGLLVSPFFVSRAKLLPPAVSLAGALTVVAWLIIGLSIQH